MRVAFEIKAGDFDAEEAEFLVVSHDLAFGQR